MAIVMREQSGGKFKKSILFQRSAPYHHRCKNDNNNNTGRSAWFSKLFHIVASTAQRVYESLFPKPQQLVPLSTPPPPPPESDSPAELPRAAYMSIKKTQFCSLLKEHSIQHFHCSHTPTSYHPTTAFKTLKRSNSIAGRDMDYAGILQKSGLLSLGNSIQHFHCSRTPRSYHATTAFKTLKRSNSIAGRGMDYAGILQKSGLLSLSNSSPLASSPISKGETIVSELPRAAYMNIRKTQFCSPLKEHSIQHFHCSHTPASYRPTTALKTLKRSNSIAGRGMDYAGILQKSGLLSLSNSSPLASSPISKGETDVSGKCVIVDHPGVQGTNNGHSDPVATSPASTNQSQALNQQTLGAGSGTNMGVFDSSWQAPKNPIFGLSVDSLSPSTGFSFGVSASSCGVSSSAATISCSTPPSEDMMEEDVLPLEDFMEEDNMLPSEDMMEEETSATYFIFGQQPVGYGSKRKREAGARAIRCGSRGKQKATRGGGGFGNGTRYRWIRDRGRASSVSPRDPCERARKRRREL